MFCILKDFLKETFIKSTKAEPLMVKIDSLIRHNGQAIYQKKVILYPLHEIHSMM